MFCSERHCAASWRCSLDTIRPKPECSLLDSGSGSGVGQVNNLRADCQSAQMARVNNPCAGWHPAPQAKRITLGFALAASLTGAVFDWNLPNGFPRPAIPADNPMNVVKVELGRYLFYDGRMSVNGKESCGTCHRQELAFTDGRARAQGTTGQLHPRGSMSLVNVAYIPFLTWANPTITSLEAQALVPMLSEEPIELGLKWHEFLDAVRRDPIYQTRFPQAFPGASDLYTLPN